VNIQHRRRTPNAEGSNLALAGRGRFSFFTKGSQNFGLKKAYGKGFRGKWLLGSWLRLEIVKYGENLGCYCFLDGEIIHPWEN